MRICGFSLGWVGGVERLGPSGRDLSTQAGAVMRVNRVVADMASGKAVKSAVDSQNDK
jgi:hypothetical protein